MRPVFVVLAAIAATLAAGAPATAQEFRKAPTASQATRLQLDEASVSEGRASKVYIVQMSDKPAISYEGGVSGLAKTAPGAGERYNARTSQAQMYAAHLGANQNALLARVGASGRNMIYSYRHAMNGFAARLTEAQAARLRKDKSVLNVWEDRAVPLDTNNTPSFLGLKNPKTGLREKHGLRGDGIIIGMIDTGAVQEHPGFDDTGINPPPPHWAGICEPGEGWSADDCNNKLIGARFFLDGFLVGAAFDDLAVPGEFQSPRDSDGHGTHTATTAAGRVTQASLSGTPVAVVGGMAPRAHLAIYKACWEAIDPNLSGCYFSDTMMATDTAVADGVDIISYSIGTAAAFNDPTDIAFLFATDAGVIVSRSAGNTGPAPATTAAGEPWVISVAASTTKGKAFVDATRVNSPASLAGDYPSLEGATTAELAVVGPITDDVVAANPLDACTPIDAVGTIVLIERGGCTFDVKLTNAVAAGADAALVFTNELAPGVENPKTVMGGDLTFPIPGVMIDRTPGLAIRDVLAGGTGVNVTLQKGIFVTEKRVGNVMAGFSSRGPYRTVPDWIKPDVTAPGAQILAGATPEPNDGSVGGLFQYLSGTSMSTPHVTGAAALLREAHRDWSPAAIKSALMTTARQNVVKEDGSTPADPFDFGAGHIFPNEAIDPGLVYDAGLFDYFAASCGTVTPLVTEASCDILVSLGFSLDPSDLNVPSIGIGELLGTQTVRRTVTNVGKKYATYFAGQQAPAGFRMQVNPRTLTLQPGESATYEVTFTNIDAPAGDWRFGFIFWKDGKGHGVRSPIAVRAQAIAAPADISGEGPDGGASFDVSFGYNGTYSPAPHGLVNPFLSLGEVGQDPDQSFNFLDPPGEVLAYLLEIPEGTVHAQWSLFDEYVDGDHDLDIYLFYCPNFLCSQVDFSAGPTSNERVSVSFPLNDAAINDPYVLIVHGFATEGGVGGPPAQFILFDWTDPGVGADLGNMTVSGASAATIGGMTTVNVNWAGLATGPGAKQVGAVSHSDGTGIQGLTIINIANDAGAGFCSFAGLCPP